MTRFVHKHAWEHKLMRVPIDPVDHYQGQLVSPFQGEKIEITGTIKGKPFQPTVCFVPSRKS